MDNIFLKSPGGSGVRYLYNCYGRKNLSGGREWFNPHQRFDDNYPRGSKVFYVMAHPLNVLLSFDRGGLFKSEELIRNLQGDVNMWREKGIESLEDYANVGLNLFDFEEHHRSCGKSVDLINLTYEHLGQQQQQIPLLFHYVEFVQRKSDFNKIPRDLLYKLKDIHHSDIEYYYNAFQSEPYKIGL